MDTQVAAEVDEQPADEAQLRAVQQERLRCLRDELIAKGADSSAYLPALRVRADSWPE